MLTYCPAHSLVFFQTSSYFWHQSAEMMLITLQTALVWCCRLIYLEGNLVFNFCIGLHLPPYSCSWRRAGWCRRTVIQSLATQNKVHLFWAQFCGGSKPHVNSLTGHWFHSFNPPTIFYFMILSFGKQQFTLTVCARDGGLTPGVFMSVSAAWIWRGAQDCWELPRPLHRREGLRLQGLHLPPHHPSVHVPGDAAMRVHCVRFIVLLRNDVTARLGWFFISILMISVFRSSLCGTVW